MALAASEKNSLNERRVELRRHELGEGVVDKHAARPGTCGHAVEEYGALRLSALDSRDCHVSHAVSREERADVLVRR